MSSSRGVLRCWHAGDLALDLYLPSLPEPRAGSAIAAAPVAIVVHGGGWERGDRRMERPFAELDRVCGGGFVHAAG